MNKNYRDIKAILYVRVSSDEQAEGCSLEVQEAYLRSYCANHGINVIAVYREDYSARHFDLKRPELKKIYEYCKKHKHEVDKVLFLRWDRYARNVEFAFTYKRKFYDEMGVEINAIESPIDFKATEWSMLLAMYCGTAHTEDDKISRRTKDGIRGHRLKGEWTNRAPRGYKNVRRAKHDCWIEVDEAKAADIRKAFKEIAKGVEKPNCIRRRLFPHIPETTFFEMLRNKFYIGIVSVPSYDDDQPEQEVRGKHEPIIDEATFYAVQDIIDGKKKKTPKMTRTLNPKLYLRRFLTCPVCGHILTGATSKGHGGEYTYYFCNHDHKHINVRAEVVNDGFADFVGRLKPNPALLEIYHNVLQDIRGDQMKENKKTADKLQVELDKLIERINRVNDMYFDGDITKAEKDHNLSRYNAEVAKLKDQIEVLRLSEDLRGAKEKLTYSMDLIGNLGGIFKSGQPEVKIKLLGSIFPEKIEFDGKNYRTRSFNTFFEAIFQETRRLQGKKKPKPPNSSGDSGSVPRAGIEPARYCYHRILSPARLPIPPAGQGWAHLGRQIGLQSYCKILNLQKLLVVDACGPGWQLR